MHVITVQYEGVRNNKQVMPEHDFTHLYAAPPTHKHALSLSLTLSLKIFLQTAKRNVQFFVNLSVQDHRTQVPHHCISQLELTYVHLTGIQLVDLSSNSIHFVFIEI